MRLYPSSKVAYTSEGGPFAKEMSIEEKAIQWIIHFTQKVGIAIYGGYYGPAYIHKGILFIVDPGHESPKYAGLDAYDLEGVVDVYKKVHSSHSLSLEGCEPSIYDMIENIHIELQGV